MTLREFKCVECGCHTFVYFDEYPGEFARGVFIDPKIRCAFCSDDVTHVADHNLTLSDFPKVDSVKEV